VAGWLADLFRFVWALLYWNTRKSWFRLRRGGVACPCQSPSDSGRAFETRCDACVNWDRPERFRRVCPLLVRTKDGLRCSVDTPEVRPFWGVAARYYGGTVLAIYAAAVITVFGILRSIGYPVSIVHVALPPLWHRVGQARGWFFLMRSQQAFAAGRTNEGLLYLANSYEFDPTNYDAGLALAKAYQVGQPSKSDEIFSQLLHEHPQHRDATAQHWFRALLARGDFAQVSSLALAEVQRDSSHANVWMRALLFATGHAHDTAPLRVLLATSSPEARVWHPVIQTELAVRSHDLKSARALLNQTWAPDAPAFTVVYRVETLVELGDPTAALDTLVQQRRSLDDEAYLTLRLHCLAAAGAEQVLRSEFETYLLQPPLSQPVLKIMCAQLIRHPDRGLFERVCAKVAREAMPLNDATAGGWFSLLCTAGAVGDETQLHALTLRLRQASQTPFTALLMVEAFFRRQVADTRAVSFLPFLPVPLEITYALIDRYPDRASDAATANRTR
jgi:hypothetical protein